MQPIRKKERLRRDKWFYSLTKKNERNETAYQLFKEKPYSVKEIDKKLIKIKV